jgi:predicted kinase
VAGPPGAGKSTISDRLARAAAVPLTMHFHTDHLYTYVRNGAVAPYRPEAAYQNLVLAHALAASVVVIAKGGYQVYVDGVVGPRSLEIWRNAAKTQDLALHYILLMPQEDAAVDRVLGRTGRTAMKDGNIARRVWRSFQEDPLPTANMIDSTHQTIDETVEVIWRGLAENRFHLP